MAEVETWVNVGALVDGRRGSGPSWATPNGCAGKKTAGGGVDVQVERKRGTGPSWVPLTGCVGVPMERGRGKEAPLRRGTRLGARVGGGRRGRGMPL